MFRISPYNYLVSFTKKGKVVDLYFLQTVDEVEVFTAIAHSRGCKVEFFRLNDDVPAQELNKEPIESKEPSEAPKKPTNYTYWERPVQCLETGEIFPSIKECAKKYGISYKSLYNCIRSGNPRKGLHFFFSQEGQTLKKRRGAKGKRIVCLNTGHVYKSMKQCTTKLQIDTYILYRALYTGKPVNGKVLAYE